MIATSHVRSRLNRRTGNGSVLPASQRGFPVRNFIGLSGARNNRARLSLDRGQNRRFKHEKMGHVYSATGDALRLTPEARASALTYVEPMFLVALSVSSGRGSRECVTAHPRDLRRQESLVCFATDESPHRRRVPFRSSDGCIVESELRNELRSRHGSPPHRLPDNLP